MAAKALAIVQHLATTCFYKNQAPSSAIGKKHASDKEECTSCTEQLMKHEGTLANELKGDKKAKATKFNSTKCRWESGTKVGDELDVRTVPYKMAAQQCGKRPV